MIPGTVCDPGNDFAILDDIIGDGSINRRPLQAVSGLVAMGVGACKVRCYMDSAAYHLVVQDDADVINSFAAGRNQHLFNGPSIDTGRADMVSVTFQGNTDDGIPVTNIR